jgi:hypothetical protein
MVIIYSVNKTALKEEIPIGDFIFRTPSEFIGATNYIVLSWIVKNIKIEKCFKVPNKRIETSPHCIIPKIPYVMNSNFDAIELDTGPFFVVYKNKTTVEDDVPLYTVDCYEQPITKRLVVYTPQFNPNLEIYKL